MKKVFIFIIVLLTTVTGFSQNSSWSLTGNSGTTSSNFLGTLDNKPLIIKVNGKPAGYTGYDGDNHTNVSFGFSALINSNTGTNNTAIGAGALRNNRDSMNTAVGTYALHHNTTGNHNTAVGSQAMEKNTTGWWNVGLGHGALFSNTSGFQNTAVGVSALWSNTTGEQNVGIGQEALAGNLDGNWNTAVGTKALWSTENIGNEAIHFGHASNNTAVGFEVLEKITTGSENTGMGTHALNSTTTGNKNVAIGWKALFKNTIGHSNLAIGAEALHANTSGYSNLACGERSLYENTTGYGNVAIGSYSLGKNISGTGNVAIGNETLRNNEYGSANIAIGALTLNANIRGSHNLAIGYAALKNNTTGEWNTAIGRDALVKNINGNSNTAIGVSSLSSNIDGICNTSFGGEALKTNVSGIRNTAIGYGADVTSENLRNATAIGYNTKVNESNKVQIGNTNVRSIGGQVGWTTFSDGRAKRNIKNNVPGLDFINALEPVTYTLSYDVIDQLKRADKNKIEEVNIQSLSQEEIKKRKIQEQKIHTGFIAQDVEKAAQSLGYDFSGVDIAESENGVYGLRYAEFVVPLIQAVQELSAQNTDLQNQINELRKQIEKQDPIEIKENNKLDLHSATIEQNIPNPFNKSTAISYTIPYEFSNSRIVIVDESGKLARQIPIISSGSGNVTIDTSSMDSGIYYYSLYINNNLIDTKKMIVKN